MAAMARVTFIGTGEAFDEQLPNTSLLYRGDRTLLLDCGYAVPHAFWRAGVGADELDAIYLTHIHADHAFGLPALLLRMREDGRERPLSVLGGPGVGGWLTRLLELGYPGAYAAGKCFPIEPVEVSPKAPLALGALTLRNAQSAHPVRNLSVRIEEAGHAFCYSGDGAPTPATRALYDGADLLVHECYSAEPDVPGHAHAPALLELAETASVAQLALLHLSRSRKAAVQRCVASYSGSVHVHLPAPGDELEVSPGGGVP